MEDRFVLAISVADEAQCTHAVNLLAGEGIETQVVNKKDSMYQFGDIEIYVPIDQMGNAKNILKEFIG
jgi:hypothetical protein